MRDLHKRFGPGLEIMVFPSDEFGKQELPEGKICDFVANLGLPADEPGFHVMAKTEVNGARAHPVWSYAKAAFPGEVRWNFDAIFLFDKQGKCVHRTSLRQAPTVEQIQKLM
uniref:Glutathione peroxidase n=1 Tax=Haptolina brevifila TaxID=156173 RepID=A0A7S2BUD0_9EUKA|mmetsp:Transcript_16871/g.34052  ORF Transcript_16871/g.34052 Transcript_16871/m.34052 type:complete len:112 (+) Transcript_16871:396-731(+)